MLPKPTDGEVVAIFAKLSSLDQITLLTRILRPDGESNPKIYAAFMQQLWVHRLLCIHAREISVMAKSGQSVI